MKTITMSLKEYEDIMKAKKETLEAIDKNMVCEKSQFGKIKWFDLGKDLKGKDDKISDLEKINIDLIINLDDCKGDVKSQGARILLLETQLFNRNKENMDLQFSRDISFRNHKREIKCLSESSVKKFKKWKKWKKWKRSCEI